MLHFFINIQDKKNSNLYQILKRIPGVSKNKVNFICKKTGILQNCPWSLLSETQVRWLSSWLESNFVGSHAINLDFKRKEEIHLALLKRMRHYHGLRLSQGLPVRGQKTHSNAKTARRISKNIKKLWQNLNLNFTLFLIYIIFILIFVRLRVSPFLN